MAYVSRTVRAMCSLARRSGRWSDICLRRTRRSWKSAFAVYPGLQLLPVPTKLRTHPSQPMRLGWLLAFQDRVLRRQDPFRAWQEPSRAQQVLLWRRRRDLPVPVRLPSWHALPPQHRHTSPDQLLPLEVTTLPALHTSLPPHLLLMQRARRRSYLHDSPLRDLG